MENIENIDNFIKDLCQFTIDTQDHNIDSFLAFLDMIHNFTALTQQELADIANGTIIFSEKYMT